MALDKAFDQLHIWHPYTSMLTPLPSYPVVRAAGCELILEDGTRLTDGMASWWCAIHGYNVPGLNAAIKEQIEAMSHVMFGGITHAPAIELCKRLLQLTPKKLEKVFLSDSGSVAVEVALKMALQFWKGKKISGKNRIAACQFGYHGDTVGAMSVCDPVNGMHSLFTGFIPENIFLKAPPNGVETELCNSLIAEWREVLQQYHQEIAAWIIEPVVQGAGGMRIYNPGYLRVIRELCDEFDILLIFDEIATGFGRTGRIFAMEHAGVEPDILCLGKALTGGYLSLAATLTTQTVAETICQSDAGVFMHGPTFMGNPLACHVACASIDAQHSLELYPDSMLSNVQRIERQLQSELLPLKAVEGVGDVRVLGAIGVVELVEPVEMATAQAFLVSLGVWIRPFGKLLYIMPPYIISTEQLSRLTDAMKQFVLHRKGER